MLRLVASGGAVGLLWALGAVGLGSAGTGAMAHPGGLDKDAPTTTGRTATTAVTEPHLPDLRRLNRWQEASSPLSLEAVQRPEPQALRRYALVIGAIPVASIATAMAWPASSGGAGGTTFSAFRSALSKGSRELK